MRSTKNKKGFSLVEHTTVMAVLVGIVVAVFCGAIYLGGKKVADTVRADRAYQAVIEAGYASPTLIETFGHPDAVGCKAADDAAAYHYRGDKGNANEDIVVCCGPSISTRPCRISAVISQ